MAVRGIDTSFISDNSGQRANMQMLSQGMDTMLSGISRGNDNRRKDEALDLQRQQMKEQNDINRKKLAMEDMRTNMSVAKGKIDALETAFSINEDTGIDLGIKMYERLTGETLDRKAITKNTESKENFKNLITVKSKEALESNDPTTMRNVANSLREYSITASENQRKALEKTAQSLDRSAEHSQDLKTFKTDARGVFPGIPSEQLDLNQRRGVDTFNKIKDSVRIANPKELGDLAAADANISKINDIISEVKNNPDIRKNFGAFTARWKEMASNFVPDQSFEKSKKMIKGLISSLYGDAGKQLSDTELAMATKAWLPKLEAPVENAIVALEFMRDEANRKLESKMQFLTNAGVATELSQFAHLMPNARDFILSSAEKEKVPANAPSGGVRYERVNGKLVRVQ